MDPQYRETLGWGYGVFALVALLVGPMAIRSLLPLDSSLMSLADAPPYAGLAVVAIALALMLAVRVGRLGF